MADSVIRIGPYYYIHVLDNNTNVTRVEVGPKTFTRQDHEKLVLPPTAMITIPPRHYCIVANPAKVQDGKVVVDKHGQIKLSHGDKEIRFEQEPFALYPGEKLSTDLTPLQVVAPNSALRLKALRDSTDADGTVHQAGDEWLFEGPGTYMPRVEAKVVEPIAAAIVRPNQALKLRARKECIDRKNVARKAGEEWLVREEGAYLPGVDEVVVASLDAYILTDKKALHLRATRTFKDALGRDRKAGDEWLITLEDSETHIPDVYEEVVGEVSVISLTGRQYVVVLDPVDEKGRPQLGRKVLRCGELSFFLQPGERLESGIQNVYVLGAEEALLLRATEDFEDTVSTPGKSEPRKAGDRWMIYGPCDFFPPTTLEVVELRQAIPLDENEGIYVRDIGSGKVMSVIGETYMLKPHEELWEKDLPSTVEDLLVNDVDPIADRGDYGHEKKSGKVRDRTRVVVFRAPHNAAVQIYDYKEKKARVVFGPDMVMLGPDEQFTVLALSGDKPKRPNCIKSLALLLGPDFMTDVVQVETSDHARLRLQLSYNWYFDIDRANPAHSAQIFSVPDFVGDACKAIASRVRGAVAAVPFDAFHKASAKIIRSAVFGTDDDGKVSRRFDFDTNRLVITNIDIQSVEPVDQRTRDSLQKSVQLAIEITTKSQEAAARHEAERVEQEARGRLERQRIDDEAKAEAARKALLSLQAESAAVESTGQAKAEAKARAEANGIEGEASVEMAKLKAQALEIETQAEVSQLRSKHEAEIEYTRALNELEIKKAEQLSTIEATKFKATVDAIGANTIEAMARAGPEMQAKLLSSLNLQGTLITDGNSPINLFNTASGLIGGAALPPSQ
eukprot:GFYU01001339.1.p1 GENE.GFYU01001339.1~~GFYU01001339.1.p1  ORF type:complete len:879 (-),score=334.91 GFYU01001339.1:45-2579(-)